jgi:RNA polymerase sigma-70 factor, ECF subfamily
LPQQVGVPEAADGRVPAAGAAAGAEAWLERFHRGDRRTLEGCYRDHFVTVERAIGSLLGLADRETAIHELFSRLIGSPDLRRSFQGGSFAAWLATVARHQAIDTWRRTTRETSALAEAALPVEGGHWEETAQARLLIERFRQGQLPAEWQGVFELRFLEQLPQREAAAKLSLPRTTLAYREIRIRRLLRRFLLAGGDEPSVRAPSPSSARPPLKEELP